MSRSSYTSHLTHTTLLAAAWFATIVATACGGDGVGDDNANNVGDGGAAVDAGPDAGEPDAWSYDCPAVQPEGHFCLRGQVRHIVDDSPVSLSAGGATVQRLIPAEGGNRPTELQAEAEVRPDGRFIFPSVEKYIRQDVSDEICNDWHFDDCFPYRYDHFDLVIATDAPSYHVPRNRYGVAYHAFVDPSDYIFGLYLIANDTYDTWQDNWPGESHVPLPECCPLEPVSFDDLRLIVPVCYEHFHEDPPDLYPGDNVSVYLWGNQAADVEMCWALFEPDRLSYPYNTCGGYPANYVNLGLFLFDPTLDSSATYGFYCDTGLGLPFTRKLHWGSTVAPESEPIAH